MEESMLNINEADATQFATLKGISLKLAEAIVAHRETHGAFASVDDLTAVRGMSAQLVAQFADQVTLDEPTPATEEPPEEDVPPFPDEEPAITWQPLEPLAAEPDPISEPDPQTEPDPSSVEPGPSKTRPRVARLDQLADSSVSADWRTIFTAVGGAVLGALLTLGLLLVLNGTLRFGSVRRVNELEAVLEDKTGTVINEQNSLTDGLATLEAEMNDVEVRGEISAEEINTLQADIAVRQAEVATVAAFANGLESRMDNVLTAGDNLSIFLEGMDNLLDELNPEPTATPTVRPTATEKADATATTQPTRTPRPTATPIAGEESDE